MSGQKIVKGLQEAVEHARDTSAIEAIAEAWASIDGKLTPFRHGRLSKDIEAYGGHYAGYMADAEELLRRVQARGFALTRVVPVLGEVPVGEES